jgi:hypothetical protein
MQESLAFCTFRVSVAKYSRVSCPSMFNEVIDLFWKCSAWKNPRRLIRQFRALWSSLVYNRPLSVSSKPMEFSNGQASPADPFRHHSEIERLRDMIVNDHFFSGTEIISTKIKCWRCSEWLLTVFQCDSQSSGRLWGQQDTVEWFIVFTYSEHFNAQRIKHKLVPHHEVQSVVLELNVIIISIDISIFCPSIGVGQMLWVIYLVSSFAFAISHDFSSSSPRRVELEFVPYHFAWPISLVPMQP